MTYGFAEEPVKFDTLFGFEIKEGDEPNVCLTCDQYDKDTQQCKLDDEDFDDDNDDSEYDDANDDTDEDSGFEDDEDDEVEDSETGFDENDDDEDDDGELGFVVDDDSGFAEELVCCVDCSDLNLQIIDTPERLIILDAENGRYLGSFLSNQWDDALELMAEFVSECGVENFEVIRPLENIDEYETVDTVSVQRALVRASVPLLALALDDNENEGGFEDDDDDNILDAD